MTIVAEPFRLAERKIPLAFVTETLHDPTYVKVPTAKHGTGRRELVRSVHPSLCPPDHPTLALLVVEGKTDEPFDAVTAYWVDNNPNRANRYEYIRDQATQLAIGAHVSATVTTIHQLPVGA